MNILYIAPFGSREFLNLHGDVNRAGLAGSVKVECIARGLASRGHNVRILSSIMTTVSSFRFARPREERLDVGSAGSVTVFYPSAIKLRPWGGALNCLRSFAILDAAVVQCRPDVAIVYNTYAFEALCAYRLSSHHGIKFWLELEDLPLARRREHLNIKPFLDSIGWRWCTENAGAFSVVNTYMERILPKTLRIELIPGIIDSRLQVIARARPPPFSKSLFTAGYFGGLIDYKGVDVLIRLVEVLPSNWRLVVTGSGPLSSKFREVAYKFPDRLIFFGNMLIEEMYQVMCDCDATIMPRERIGQEGNGVFPFKVFEYVMSGGHIISAKLPDIGGFDCRYLQRWNGHEVEGLVNCLRTAREDFNKEVIPRVRLQSLISSHCSEEAIGRLSHNLVTSIRTEERPADNITL